eukprot:1161029-Pelagomonas_calceolata.AAC.2
MALRVWCHECGVPHITNPNITNGVLRCPGCLSEFAEIQYVSARYFLTEPSRFPVYFLRTSLLILTSAAHTTLYSKVPAWT